MVALLISVGALMIVGAVMGHLNNNTTFKTMLAVIVGGILIASLSLFFIL
jgi:VIT1/CCC1 family predicted Fe2+/Mn2+ transporter